MRPRKTINKTATPTPPKKAAAAKAAKKSTTKPKKPSEVSVENPLLEVEKSTSPDVKPEETLEEKDSAAEQEEKTVLKEEGAKPVLKEEDSKPVLEEKSNAAEQEEKAVLKEEDAKPVLEEKNNAAEHEEKTVLKEEDVKPLVSAGEGLDVENVPECSRAEILEGKVEDAVVVVEGMEEEQNSDAHYADAKPAEEEKKDDVGDEAEVTDVNMIDECSELQNAMSMSGRRKREKVEVFVGGLDQEATEDDLRQVLEKIGEIAELRLMKNLETGKNKGYAFVRYTTPAEAKRAVKELADAKIRGKKCGVVPLQENDTIFLGNIDKNWTKDDVLKKLKEIGVENIYDVIVMEESNNTKVNRGFAFLELESHKDAQVAFRTLRKKNAFGEDRTIKVAWAEPLNEPDEDVMAQVKSVFVDGLLPTWNEEQVKERFRKFGEIERVVLACNMQSAKRKDFGFVNYATREAAIACIEALNKDDELIDGDSKVKVKVSLAKPAPKRKARKGELKGTNKRDSKVGNKGVSPGHVLKNHSSSTTADAVGGKGLLGKGLQLGKAVQPTLPSATHEILHIIRQQAAWGQGHVAVSGGHVGGLAHASMVPHLQPMSSVQGYGHALPGVKRPYTALGDASANSRGNPRARMESTNAAVGSSYGLSVRGQDFMSNPMLTGASVEQFYHHPSTGAALGGPYATGPASNALIGLQGASAHGGRSGGTSYHGKGR